MRRPSLTVLFLLPLYLLTTSLFSQANTSANLIPIAVLELSAEGFTASESRIVTDRLRSELFNTSRFIVLERDKMTSLLEEQGFQMSGCVSNECAVQIGRIIGVDKVVTGSIGRIGSLITINIRMVDVETSQISKIATEDCQCTVEDFLVNSIRNVAQILANADETEQPSITLRRGDGKLVNKKKVPKPFKKFDMGMGWGQLAVYVDFHDDEINASSEIWPLFITYRINQRVGLKLYYASLGNIWADDGYGPDLDEYSFSMFEVKAPVYFYNVAYIGLGFSHAGGSGYVDDYRNNISEEHSFSYSSVSGFAGLQVQIMNRGLINAEIHIQEKYNYWYVGAGFIF
ncbi:hypothetical protein JW948_15715 [bacterium]|nr:hypothetical protein [bacterium]